MCSRQRPCVLIREPALTGRNRRPFTPLSGPGAARLNEFEAFFALGALRQQQRAPRAHRHRNRQHGKCAHKSIPDAAGAARQNVKLS